jgi:hypothetical protein
MYHHSALLILLQTWMSNLFLIFFIWHWCPLTVLVIFFNDFLKLYLPKLKVVLISK